MEASATEIYIINSLKGCRFYPASFDKKFVRDFDHKNISPLQRYWIYKLGYKYRKQISDSVIENVCKLFLDENIEPISRKEANKILKQAIK